MRPDGRGLIAHYVTFGISMLAVLSTAFAGRIPLRKKPAAAPLRRRG